MGFTSGGSGGGGGLSAAELRAYDLWAAPTGNTVACASGVLGATVLLEELYEPHDWAASAHWTWDAANAALVVPADGVYALDVEVRDSSVAGMELFLQLDYFQLGGGTQMNTFSAASPHAEQIGNQRFWLHRAQSLLEGDLLTLGIGQKNPGATQELLSPSLWITRLS